MTLSKKLHLTAILGEAHNSNKRPLLRGPTDKPPFGSLTLSDRFVRRRSSALKRAGKGWVMSHKIDLGCHRIHSGAREEEAARRGRMLVIRGDKRGNGHDGDAA